MFGGTVKAALQHALTAYDKKQEAAAQKRGTHFNHYALAQYLERIDEVCEDIARGASPRAACLAAFSGRLQDVALKAIDERPASEEEKRASNVAWSYIPASTR